MYGDITIYLAVLAVLAPIGLGIDSKTKEERSRGCFLIENANYKSIVKAFYKVILGRFSGVYFFGWSIALSWAILFLVYALAFWVYGSNYRTPYLEEWLFFVPLFIFYSVGFSIVLSQTKLFVRESIFSRSSFSRFVFIFSDVITSTKIFILFISFGVFCSAAIYSLFELDPLSENANVESRVMIYKEKVSEEGDDVYLYKITVESIVDGDSMFREDIKSEIVIRSMKKHLDIDLFIPKQYIDENVWLDKGGVVLSFDELSDINFERLYSVSERKKDFISISKSLSILYDINPLFDKEDLYSRVSDLDEALYMYYFENPPKKYTVDFYSYSEIFSHIDQLEDKFVALFGGVSHFLSVRNIFLTSSSGGYTPFFYGEVCKDNNKGILINAKFLSDYGEDEYESYEDSIVTSGFLYNRELFSNAAVFYKADILVPIFILFVSTMLVSVVFYFVVVSVYFLKLLGKIVSNDSLVGVVYCRSPFFVGFVLVWVLMVLVDMLAYSLNLMM